MIRDSVARGDDISFGSYKKFIKSLEKSFTPYDMPGDALDAMKHLQMGEGSFEEHLAKFKLLMSQSGLDKSAAIVDLSRETLPHGLQRPILLSKNPPTMLQGWYNKANTFHRNWKKTQCMLGQGKASEPKKETPKKTFTFPKTLMPWTSTGLQPRKEPCWWKKASVSNAKSRATLAGIAHHEELKRRNHGLVKRLPPTYNPLSLEWLRKKRII